MSAVRFMYEAEVNEKIIHNKGSGLLNFCLCRVFRDAAERLTFREFKALFPDCEIRRERFLGLTKSYVAVRRRGV